MFTRRDFLKTSGVASLGAIFNNPILQQVYAAESQKSPIFAGWLDNKAARQHAFNNTHRPLFSQHNQAIKGSGRNKKVLLWKLFEHITGGPLVPHIQEIGDCVSHAWALGVDMLTAIQMTLFNSQEQWIAKAATEIIYAGSRVEIGGGLRGDGSMGTWAKDYCEQYGSLLRQPYLNGKYDFTFYNGFKARELGAKGVPNNLEPLTKLHPVRTAKLVTNWDEACDCVANGYPVTLCSSIGYTNKRDKAGFLRRGRPWMHAMLLIAIDNQSERKGGCIQNSWGHNWVSGPTRHEQPEGSFWADAKNIEMALKQGDSFALSGYVGYPRQDIDDYRIW